MRITASAIYFRDGDFILVEIFVTDPATETYVITKVTSGLCELIYATTTVLAEASFDLYHGNADGSFRVNFLHPARIRNLEVHLTIDLSTGEHLEVTRPVVIDNKVTEKDLSVNVGGLHHNGSAGPFANEDDL